MMNITDYADCIIPGNVDVVDAAAPNVFLIQWWVQLQHHIIFMVHIFGLVQVSLSV